MNYRKKILLLGATGMAGHVVYLYLHEMDKYEIRNVVFRNKLTEDSIIVDVTNKEDVENVIRREKPNIIINCIGVLIRGSQKYPENAIYINAYLPHLLKKLSDEVGAKLIHISTDCVFSGKKGFYTETDFKDADDVYGRSKALGEILNDKDLTIRTSIIGPELKKDGEGLFHWFMHQDKEVNGFLTSMWGGVTTLELAKAIDYAIDHNYTGLVQLSNGVAISKYELLNLFKEIWNKNTLINPIDANGIDKSIAKSTVFLYEVPSYREMLIDMDKWYNKHTNDLYINY